MGKQQRTRRLIVAGGLALIVVAALVVAVGTLRGRQGPQQLIEAAAGGTSDIGALPLAPGEYPVPDDAVLVSPTGKDSAPGSKAAPLRTLAAAIGKVPAGGTVVLRGGTYRETVGTVNKRVTIQSYPGEKVWLKGSVLVDDWARAGQGWQHGDWKPDLCDHCFLPQIIDPKHPQAGLPDMVFLDGKPLRQVGSADDLGAGTFFVDRTAHSLLIGDDPAGHQVEATTFDRLLQFDPKAAGSAIRGIGVEQYGSNQDYGNHGGMVVVNAPDVTIDRSTFAWSASSGVIVFKPGTKVTGSSFLRNGLVGLVANKADGIRLTGSTFEANNQELFTLNGSAIGAAGVKITRTKRPFVADNSFVNNVGSGWWCDLGCTDAMVIRNRAIGNAVNGLYYEVSARALIASNVIAGNKTRGLKISSSDHVRVMQNTFSGNDISLGIYNDERSPAFDPYSAGAGLSWFTTDTELVNNFYAQSSANPVVESGDNKKEPLTGTPFVSRSDGSVYLRSGVGPSVPLVVWSLGSGRTSGFGALSEFTAATGQDQHAQEGDLGSSPFRNPDDGDYALLPGAPGARGGQPLGAELAKLLGVDATPTPDVGVLR